LWKAPIYLVFAGADHGAYPVLEVNMQLLADFSLSLALVECPACSHTFNATVPRSVLPITKETRFSSGTLLPPYLVESLFCPVRNFNAV
jgi:hypothetical protein